MTNERFTFLVNEVVVKNGEGHKLLEQLVEDNEISKLEETKILIAAKLAILSKKVDEWCERLE
jgi:coenzyme F420-reducing hydrogenase beta subunit